jgi:putative peptidoglycan lipid II flippase
LERPQFEEPILALDSAVENDDSLVGDSLAGSVWTGVSRATGFVRAVGIAAVLGATYFGNTYQALNSLPNLVYYQLLAGSVFASVLVPVLVRHINEGDEKRARDVLTGFLGTMLAVAAAAAALLIVGGWVVLQLMAAGVSDPSIAAAQRHVGFLLLLLFVPQVALYVVAGIGVAAMNAKRHFAVAAAAPALENVVIIVFLVIAVVLYGSETDITRVKDLPVIVLGLGATLAVLCHAGLEWWGANRCGMRMIPRKGWRDDDVRLIVKRMGPALAYSGMAFLQVLAFLIVANRVAGGVVTLQLALNFFYLPLALVAWPIARALLPQLASRKMENNAGMFAVDLRRAVTLSSFVAIPISVAYVALAFPLARVVAFGKLGSAGVEVLGWSIAALGVGVLFETWFIIATYASYAREDMRTPLGPMGLRVIVSIALMVAVLPVTGDAFVPLLALALSIGSLAGALRMFQKVRRSLREDEELEIATALEGYLERVRSGRFDEASPAVPTELATAVEAVDEPSFGSSIGRSLVASVVMAPVAYFVALVVGTLWSGKLNQIAALGAASVAGASVFIGVHMLFRSPEIDWIKSSLLKRGSRKEHEVEAAAP